MTTLNWLVRHRRTWRVRMIPPAHGDYEAAPLWEEGESPLRKTIAGDKEVAWRLQREVTDPRVAAKFVIPGEPVSKSRAQVVRKANRTHAYTPRKTTEAEELIAWKFRQSKPGWHLDDAGSFGLLAVFYAQSYQRRDVDNMIKLVCDALTGVVWADDSQVIEVSGRVEKGSTDPRTAVLIYRTLPSWEAPNRDCVRCGKNFRSYESWKDTKKYCSKACRDAEVGGRRRRTCKGCGSHFWPLPYEHATRLYCSEECRGGSVRVTLTCVWCNKSFTQWKSWSTGLTYCSAECGKAYWYSRGVKSPKGKCDECGRPTSKAQAKRCLACARVTGRSRGPQFNSGVTSVKRGAESRAATAEARRKKRRGEITITEQEHQS